MSGRKNALRQFKILSAGDASQATLTSTVTNIEFLDNVGMQFNVVSGSPTGVWTIEVSADYIADQNGNVSSAGNWIAVNLPVSAAITSGSPANIYVDLNQLSAPWIRAKYTKGSGTGSLDAFIVGKML